MSQETASPRLYIIAGPNGAGKTTFANRFLPEFVTVQQFVNADLIAQGLSPFAPESVAVTAGRLMIERIDTLAQQKVDFAIESTLAGKTLVARLKALKEAAYRLHLVYLWLDSPELALARVAERVSQGGHHVPDETVHRRFFAGLRNLFALYLPLADYWVIYDNSGSEPVRIAYGDADGIRIENSDLYQWIERMGKS